MKKNIAFLRVIYFCFNANVLTQRQQSLFLCSYYVVIKKGQSTYTYRRKNTLILFQATAFYFSHQPAVQLEETRQFPQPNVARQCRHSVRSCCTASSDRRFSVSNYFICLNLKSEVMKKHLKKSQFLFRFRSLFTEKCVMNNYFGIGLDAKIALDFHKKREDNPKKTR